MDPLNLTEDMIDEIAEKAAQKAVEKITANVYQQVGKSVISKFTWIIGVIALSAFFWMTAKGMIKV